jgi:glycosyltransferase involved in cell wall biosynthesis
LQDFPSDQIQILVVDDGSTDDSSERVKKYGARIEYVYKRNGGQASALNFGIAKVRGEIIALLDADDLFQPGKLTRVAEAFAKNPDVGMVYHRMLEWDMATNERREWNYPAISGDFRAAPEKFLSYIPHPTSCISFRRSSLNRLLPIPENIRMLADGFLVSLIPFLSPILAIPECLAVYRFHGNNSYHADEVQMSPAARKQRLEERQVLLDAKRKWLADNGFTREQQPVRDFLDRWTLYQETDAFLLNPPSRLRFFRHLLLYNRCYGPHLSWRLRLINFINAFGSLAVGYKHFYVLDKWREQLLGKLKTKRQ